MPLNDPQNHLNMPIKTHQNCTAKTRRIHVQQQTKPHHRHIPHPPNKIKAMFHHSPSRYPHRKNVQSIRARGTRIAKTLAVSWLSPGSAPVNRRCLLVGGVSSARASCPRPTSLKPSGARPTPPRVTSPGASARHRSRKFLASRRSPPAARLRSLIRGLGPPQAPAPSGGEPCCFLGVRPRRLPRLSCARPAVFSCGPVAPSWARRSGSPPHLIARASRSSSFPPVHIPRPTPPHRLSRGDEPPHFHQSSQGPKGFGTRKKPRTPPANHFLGLTCSGSSMCPDKLSTSS